MGESNENLKDDDDGQFAKFNDELTKVPTYSIIENYFNLGKMKKSVNRSKKRKGRSPERLTNHNYIFLLLYRKFSLILYDLFLKKFVDCFNGD